MAELDRIDITLVRLLQNNARFSNKQLAAKVGLAPSSCHERLKKLWDMGVLTGAHAAVDPARFGLGLQALLMIGLTKHERDTVDSFLDHAAAVPEVTAVYLITGQYDVVVHVTVRDTTHLKNLALDNFNQQYGVARIETSIVYEARHNPVMPDMVAEPGEELSA